VLAGRVASLLEVGTGFHNELSGRENIFLNGAILGMSRAEILRKFDEIVAFAEVEKFIDTPVKHYSSGMYLRLAFAVAAHLEPEILLVDEVLAVGDQRFQRKCLDKMEDVGRHGRTVLFVSHNMPAITRLCPRTVLLDGGRVVADGPSHKVVSAYLSSGLGTRAEREWPPASAPGDERARLRGVHVRTEGRVSEVVDVRHPVEIEICYEILRAGQVLIPSLHFVNEEGLSLFWTADAGGEWGERPRPPGRYSSRARVPGNLFAEGTILVGVALTTPTPDRYPVYERDAVAFQVVDPGGDDAARGTGGGSLPGIIRPLLEWRTERTGGDTQGQD
jgi:lipopolysaccharide transport system ATP-binding protein